MLHHKGKCCFWSRRSAHTDVGNKRRTFGLWPRPRRPSWPRWRSRCWIWRTDMRLGGRHGDEWVRPLDLWREGGRTMWLCWVSGDEYRFVMLGRSMRQLEGSSYRRNRRLWGKYEGSIWGCCVTMREWGSLNCWAKSKSWTTSSRRRSFISVQFEAWRKYSVRILIAACDWCYIPNNNSRQISKNNYFPANWESNSPV